MILFIQEFISFLNSYNHTEDLDLPLSLQLQNFTQFMDLVPWEQFSLHYFHKLEIIRSNHWKIVWKGLFNFRLPYYLFIVIFIIVAFHLLLLSLTSWLFSCLSSADFKMANSTTSLSPLSLVCCCFLGTDLTHAYTCLFWYGSDLILWEWLNLLKTPLRWLALFMLLASQNTSETLITIIHRWWDCR